MLVCLDSRCVCSLAFVIVVLLATLTAVQVGSSPSLVRYNVHHGSGMGVLLLRERYCAGLQGCVIDPVFVVSGGLSRPLRGGSTDTHDVVCGMDDADIIGDVLGEGESDDAVESGAHLLNPGGDESSEAGKQKSESASEVSAPGMSSGVDDEGRRIWGVRKASVQAMQNIGSGREVWKGKYWANIDQKRCEIHPLQTRKETAEGIIPKSILWGEDCPEATMEPPSGYFRPYGDAIPLNDTSVPRPPPSHLPESPCKTARKRNAGLKSVFLPHLPHATHHH